MAEYDPETGDETIVPLSSLHPSREHFGPVSSPHMPRQPNPQANAQQSRAQHGQGQQSQRPGPRGQRPQQGPPAQRQPRGEAQVGSTNNGQQYRQHPQRPRDEVIDLRAPGAGAHAAGAPQGQRLQGQGPRPQLRRPPYGGGEPVRRPGGPQSQQGRDPRYALPAAQREQSLRRMVVEREEEVGSSAQVQSGWRGLLARATGGVVSIGPSSQERREAAARQALRRPVTEGTIAVFSRKGGVGKTTISAYLGLTLAAERGGRIVALDGDAEAGSLGWLLAPRAPSTLAALASANPIPNDYAELRRYSTPTPEGLDVIVGDPAEIGPISATGLEAVADQLARHYDISIFDTGAGVTRATGRVLVNTARVLLLVMGPSVDSVRAAERTLAWLDERPGEAVDPDAQVIAVINGIPSNIKSSHVERIESHFADRCSAVVRIPWDAHLAAGSTAVSLERLAKPTRQAFIELAGTAVGALARPARRPAMAGRRG